MPSVRTVTFPPSIGIPDESRSLYTARRAQVDSFVFTAVLAAAACHAGWNTLLKLRLEPVVATAWWLGRRAWSRCRPCSFTAGRRPAWPYLLGSVAIHIVYFLTLAEAYRGGDLGQVYPIARGTAPLMTRRLGQRLDAGGARRLGWGGVTALAAGILLLAVQGRRALAASTRARSASRCSPRSPSPPTRWSTARCSPVGGAVRLHRPGCSC